MTEVHWLPPIIAAAVALLFALAYLLGRKKPAAAPLPDDDVRADLDRRVQNELDALKELIADQHQWEPTAFAAEKARLEQAAADAMRARDGYEEEKSPRPPPSPKKPSNGFWARNPQLKGAVWGAGIMAFFGGMFLLLTQEQKARDQGMGMTGAQPGMSTSAPDPHKNEPDPELDAAMADLEKAPDDVDRIARAVHLLLGAGVRMQEAEQLTYRALALDPFQVENRVHRSVLRATRGEFPRALEELQQLADTYPDAYESLLMIGALSMHRQDYKGALAALERYSAEAPASEQSPELQETIAVLRSRVK